MLENSGFLIGNKMIDYKTFKVEDSRLISKFIEEFGISSHDALKLIKTAPKRYKVYEIEKKNKKGTRTIAHPASELKLLQRWLVQNFLNNDKFPVHKSATAYEQGKSIIDNASPHKENNYILKLDFKDFFPSITQKDFFIFIKDKGIKISEADLFAISQALFRLPKGENLLELSIGAPSSPKVSNIIMYDFDKSTDDYCTKNNIKYTRYADDLTFSTNKPDILKNCLKEVEAIIKKLEYPKLSLNIKKTIFSSKKHRRIVTGLILTNDGNISLGRDKKRLISAKIHHFKNNKLSPDECFELQGHLAYINVAEKAFLHSMENKYGKNVITAIKLFKN